MKTFRCHIRTVATGALANTVVKAANAPHFCGAAPESAPASRIRFPSTGRHVRPAPMLSDTPTVTAIANGLAGALNSSIRSSAGVMVVDDSVEPATILRIFQRIATLWKPFALQEFDGSRVQCMLR